MTKKSEKAIKGHYNEVEWKVTTVGLLTETLLNKGTSILAVPFKIFGDILYEVGEAAARINDPILNGLMCRLAIYEMSDPYSKEYDKKQLEEVMEKYKEAKKKLKDGKL